MNDPFIGLSAGRASAQALTKHGEQRQTEPAPSPPRQKTADQQHSTSASVPVAATMAEVAEAATSAGKALDEEAQTPEEENKTLADLRDRIITLEKASWNIPPSLEAGLNLTTEALTQMSRARSAVIGANCTSAAWKVVPPEYYTWNLEQRRVELGATNTYQLCKSMLMENIKCNNADCSDRTNARYYLVVVQYRAEINGKKLASEIRALRPVGKGRLEPKQFEFRLASSEDNDRLTGYVHNSVTPFGLKDGKVPIVLASDITKVRPSFMWMGGGHVDLKLGMAVEEFVRGVGAIVVDVSDTKSGAFVEE